jgi:uncharacterized protein YbjT (DUF2867 family)
MKQVLVTGATGNIGSRLIPRLASRPDVAVRGLVRTLNQAAPLTSAGAELALGCFEDSRTVRRAMQRIDTLVLITPAGPSAAEQAGVALAAAREAGVRKIVRISAFNAANGGPSDMIRQHGRTDAEIRASGLAYTILRPSFFMQNLCLLAARSIVREGRIYSGMGDGRLSVVDLRDVVDCAEESVLSEWADNKTFTLTGPESISFHEIADRLSTMMGRLVGYVAVFPEWVEQSVRAMRLGGWYGQVMADLCRAYSENWGDVITGDIALITGRRPRSFDVFAREVLLPALAWD